MKPLIILFILFPSCLHAMKSFIPNIETTEYHANNDSSATYLPKEVSLTYHDSEKKTINIVKSCTKIKSYSDVVTLAQLQYKIAFFALERMNLDFPTGDFSYRDWPEIQQCNPKKLNTDNKETLHVFATLIHHCNYTNAVLKSLENNPSPSSKLFKATGKSVIGIKPLLADLSGHSSDWADDYDLMSQLTKKGHSCLVPVLKDNFSRLFFLLTLIPEDQKIITSYTKKYSIFPLILSSINYYTKTNLQPIPYIEISEQKKPNNSIFYTPTQKSPSPFLLDFYSHSTQKNPPLQHKKFSTEKKLEVLITNDLYYSHDMDKKIIKMNHAHKSIPTQSVLNPLLAKTDKTWDDIKATYNMLTSIEFDRKIAHSLIWKQPTESQKTTAKSSFFPSLFKKEPY